MLAFGRMQYGRLPLAAGELLYSLVFLRCVAQTPRNLSQILGASDAEKYLISVSTRHSEHPVFPIPQQCLQTLQLSIFTD